MARILLIDDDDLFRNAMRLTLAHYGHAVSEARNGEEGLKLFHANGADLVITDLVMPEKEGLEVLMELRQQRPPVKIIAISGGGRYAAATNYLHAAKAMGASKVLAKPFANEELSAAVSELCPDTAQEE